MKPTHKRSPLGQACIDRADENYRRAMQDKLDSITGAGAALVNIGDAWLLSHPRLELTRLEAKTREEALWEADWLLRRASVKPQQPEPDQATPSLFAPWIRRI